MKFVVLSALSLLVSVVNASYIVLPPRGDYHLTSRSTTSTPTRDDLLESAQSFCNSLADKRPIEELSSHFSTTHPILIFEHGVPAFAPFIGRKFTKPEDYLNIVVRSLTYENMKFFAYMVDVETRKVNVQGSGSFTWIDTNGKWEEVFTFVFDFDHEAKITVWNLWGDTGSTYLAMEGRLGELEK